MNNSELIVSFPGFFVSEFREDSLWLKFSGNFFHNFLSFDNRNFLKEYFEQLAATPEIKTVIIHSAFSESGTDEYMRFFLFECPELDLGHFGFSNTMDRYDLHRFCSIIDQMLLDIVGLDKIVIHICSGDVLSLFMNISLACDYRIIASNTVFHNIFQEIGMLPKGGAAFFLAKILGANRTKELLLLRQRITSKEALDNGIADRVVSQEELEKTAMEIARTYTQMPEQTLFRVKRLANYTLRDLKEYLEYETHEIIKIGRSQQFGE